ncbi:MAG: prefoldin subunit [DPANN group archaeon]|nr:prefoldin subunit [DPANN group archaeon]
MTEESNKIMETQMLQQQMQNIMIQKENTRLQLLDIENAIKEVKDAKGDVYKTSGIIFIKSEKNIILKDLEEKKNDLKIRMKSLDKREEIFKKQIMGLQKEE